MLKLLNVIVKPAVLYGAEVWGSEKCDIIERLQLRFFKYVLSVNKFTSSVMVYWEFGAVPFDVDIKITYANILGKIMFCWKTQDLQYDLLFIVYIIAEKIYLSLNGWKLLRQLWTTAHFVLY